MGKKLWSFFTSMKFGLFLLGLIIVISLAGSLIPQNNEVMYYVREFPDTYNVILFLHLNNVFKSWYFLLLVFLLCLNLVFCTMRQAKTAGMIMRPARIAIAVSKISTLVVASSIDTSFFM